jgi:hypothetical protein
MAVTCVLLALRLVELGAGTLHRRDGLRNNTH